MSIFQTGEMEKNLFLCLQWVLLLTSNTERQVKESKTQILGVGKGEGRIIVHIFYWKVCKSTLLTIGLKDDGWWEPTMQPSSICIPLKEAQKNLFMYCLLCTRFNCPHWSTKKLVQTFGKISSFGMLTIFESQRTSTVSSNKCLDSKTWLSKRGGLDQIIVVFLFCEEEGPIVPPTPNKERTFSTLILFDCHDVRYRIIGIYIGRYDSLSYSC